MFELSVESSFSAAHQLHAYKGICKNVHGHNFVVKVTVNVKKLDKIGIGIDFLDLKKNIDHFLKLLDHKNLNDLEPFKKTNPTSENIAIWLYKNLSKKVNSKEVKVSKVTISESPQFSATYYGR